MSLNDAGTRLVDDTMPVTLTHKTSEAISALKQNNWFCTSGLPLQEHEKGCILAQSWDDVYDRIQRPSYLKTTDQVRWLVWHQLQNHDPMINNAKNKQGYLAISKMVLPIADGILKTAKLSFQTGSPQHFDKEVHWYILNILLNVHFSEIYDCPLISSAFQAILSGRMPCGWSGKKLEDSVLVVY